MRSFLLGFHIDFVCLIGKPLTVIIQFPILTQSLAIRTKESNVTNFFEPKHMSC